MDILDQTRASGVERIGDYLCRLAGTNGHRGQTWAQAILSDIFAHDRTMVYSFDFHDNRVQMHTCRLSDDKCVLWGTVISDEGDSSCNGDEVGYSLEKVTNLKHH